MLHGGDGHRRTFSDAEALGSAIQQLLLHKVVDHVDRQVFVFLAVEGAPESAEHAALESGVFETHLGTRGDAVGVGQCHRS